MNKAITPQHPLFIKYRRNYLHDLTGYSKSYLCRVATGKIPLSPSFITRICFKLNQNEADLFLCDLQSGGCDPDEKHELSRWLQVACRKEHLSLRQVAAKTGLSHSAVGNIMDGNRPLPATIKKLAQGFGGDSTAERLALEDRLMVLAGYKREELNQAVYLKTIPLLSPDHQHIIEGLVGELAKIEGLEVSTPRRSKSS